MKEGPLLFTKFVPPATAKDVIWVESFLHKMQQAERYGVILVRAGAGYGKSTMLSAYFSRARLEHFWLTLTEEDAELAVFLENLIHAVRSRRPRALAEAGRILRESEDLNRSWKFILNALINELHGMGEEDLYLVIEDCHLVQEATEINRALEYLLRHSPPTLRVVLTSRYPFTFLPVSEWKLKGRLLLVDEEDLAFDEREISQFMRARKNRKLSRQEAAAIREVTEGWPIAVEMIAGAVTESEPLEMVLADMRASAGDLFSFLAADVLERLPAELREFVLRAATLHSLNEAVCTALFGDQARHFLTEALQRGALLQDYGRGNYGFHRLFRDFLLYTAELEGVDVAGLRRQAADYYLAQGLREEAVEYMLEGGAHQEAARLILQLAPEMLQHARFQTVLHWLHSLPQEVYAATPAVYLLRGDIKRTLSGFHEALAVYEEAERLYRQQDDQHGVSEVLMRKALVFLDTVNPAKAEPLLMRALQIKEGLRRAQTQPLLTLIAENKVNQGRLEQARQIVERQKQQGAEPGALVEARLLLRLGRLTEAVAFIEERLANPDYLHDEQPKAHRELRLVLSLLYNLMGRRNQESMELAREVLLTSQRVGSRFTESVANSRLGHAHLTDGDLERAIGYYREAARLSDNIRVQRAKGEPHWGLTLAYAYLGDEENCRLYADSGTAICMEANDLWLAAMVRMARGVGLYVQGACADALETLRSARMMLRQAGDEHHLAVGLLWEALTIWRMGDTALFRTAAEELAAALRLRPSTFVLQRRHLWSPRDLGELKRFLIACREEAGVDLGGPSGPYHPGYTLNVRTLGEFGVSRGSEAVTPQEWTRDKAKRLFQIMLSRRGQYLSRDYLIDTLWPDKTRELGAKNLKVTLSTLNTILEPRRPEETAHFVIRSGDRYGLIDVDSLQVDGDRFAVLANRGLAYARRGMEAHAAERLEQALALYTGDFLEDAVYEEWAAAERERLRRLYLEAAEAMAQIHLTGGRYAECLALCEQILAKDNCWENAYRLMILCHARAGEKARAVQVYQQCKQVLHETLGVRPSQETVTLLKESIKGL
ncbi:MAG: BTAD domain-containing putative transcriptional regulator [Bacillota bacterium]